MLCKNPPTGSLPYSSPDFPEVFNLVSNPTLDLPFPTNGTTASVDFPCNASLPLCPVCNALTPKKKFCSKKCGTLSRVRALRAKNAPLRELKVAVENDYQSERRSPVTGCTTGTLRDVGKNTDYLRAKEIEIVRADALKRLRAASTKKRRELQPTVSITMTCRN